MRKTQRTIRTPAELSGPGLFSGVRAKLRFLPSLPNTGVTFVRVDLPNRPRVPATADHAVTRFRRTCLSKDGADVDTVEHLLSAIHGCGIDNLEIELDAQEVPVGDGSAAAFAKTLREAGILEQDAPLRQLALREAVSVVENDVSLVAVPAEEFSISYTLTYPVPVLGAQHLMLKVSDETYVKEIAGARTFCLSSEINQFLTQGLGKGANVENTIVVDDASGVVKTDLRYKDEFVRHKVLDLLGDLSLVGAAVRAHVVAVKSGHSTNLKMAKELRKRLEGGPKPARTETVLDVREIMKTLPHRYPFLLIDRVIESDGWKRAVGIKNVTINEPFFNGHFPGRPIMPGVLQLEAMAQLAGALLMRKAENQGKLAVLLSMDKVKLRKTVVPGDQLRIEAETLKLKSRTGEVFARALVEDKLVAEAFLKFMLVDPDMTEALG